MYLGVIDKLKLIFFWFFYYYLLAIDTKNKSICPYTILAYPRYKFTLLFRPDLTPRRRRQPLTS